MQDANFAMNGAGQIGVVIEPPALIELCLAENDCRMAGYDGRLLRPAAVPVLARLALRLLTAHQKLLEYGRRDRCAE